MSWLVGPPSTPLPAKPPTTPLASLLLGRRDLKVAGIEVPGDDVQRERVRSDHMLQLRMKMASSDSRFKKLFPPVAPGMLLTAESATVTCAAGEGARQEY
eukprot:7429616-Lingulodinium_polyedra.AAC.1